MTITVQATYQNGVLRPNEPLPLSENQQITITIHGEPVTGKRGYGLVSWSGAIKDLDYLIDDVDNDPLEGP